MLLCTRAMGKEVLWLCRKTAAAVEILPQFFVSEVKLMQNESNIVLSQAEKKLIQVIRSLDFGEVRVMIKDNKPIRVEEIRKSIQLPTDK